MTCLCFITEHYLHLISTDQIIKVINVLFNIHIPSLIFKIRIIVFNLLKLLIENESISKSIKSSLGIQFYSSFLESTEGEKDPRCLFVELQIYPLLYSLYELELNEKDNEGIVEETMDNLLAYFPITFSSKPNESFTKDEFMNVFYQAIVCHKSFIPFIYPEIKDKLSSDLIQAKHDSVELFTEIVKKYDITVVKEYLKEYMLLFINTYSDRNNKGVLSICEESIEIITEKIMKIEGIYIL